MTGVMATTPLLRDRLSFLHRLPILLKGTSDDDVPCPGYLFEEIAKISHESLGSSQCLLEYLLNRLHSGSGRVKLKVLKIMLHLCAHGSPSFLLILKRDPTFIQEAAGFAGPPDPLHGSSLYQKVRAAAQDLGTALFSDTWPPPPAAQPPRALPPAGMGAQCRPQSTLQGFGYSKEQGRTGSAGETFLSTIQKAAELVANAMRPGAMSPSAQRPLRQSDAYQPAVTPAVSDSLLTPRAPVPGAALGTRSRAMRPQPGQAGGGWDEPDSSSGSQSSSQENSTLSKASGSGSHSGSDSPSGASQAPSDLAESPDRCADRVEAVGLSGCLQELSLVETVMRGPHPFLSGEEVQHFVTECGLLNCEAVLELLVRRLGGARECAQMILRHFEASCRQRPPAQRLLAEPSPAPARMGPSDLLTDSVPFTGDQAFLQPLSSTLFLPKGTAPPSGLQPSPALPPPSDGTLLAVSGGTREAETRLAGAREQGPGSEQDPSDTDTPKGEPELGPGPSDCLWSPAASIGCNSLFAGMELVACPQPVGARTAVKEPLPTPQAARTLSQRAAAEEPPGPEPSSAFAFLNS
ncbi:AP-4 complex accessory subunit tepsin isoform X3 [Manis pentadactyla]|uniref:AP-4 complex accessory subunit tepsin isoform X3 n=1 Tax=Manis pentadactyla TaxID=143292 RepID=UPI00255C832A|nr:AP-4 complex accessory subunit tepsin isoform X3 [Manis pentadactyla]